MAPKKTKAVKKNSERTSRLILMLAIMILVFAALFVRVIVIKAVHGEEYEAAAQGQQVDLLDSVIEPLRGNIFDANGEPLAVSVRTYNVIMDSAVLYDADERAQASTVKALCELLGITDADGLRNCFSEKYKDWRYLKVEGGEEIGEAVMEKLQLEIDRGNVVGIWFEETETRSYPGSTLAAHLLGFNGVYGVEQYYNEYLTGTPGRKMIVSDANGAYTSELIDARNGCDLTLTINATVQYYMDQELAAAVKKYNSLNGCAICMNAKTGAILGWANAPTFDLNDVTKVFAVTPKYEKEYAVKDEQYYSRIWNNFGLTYTYQPGSTYKPIFSSMALEESAIGTGTEFKCVKAGYKVADTTFECFKQHVHGTQTLREVLINSCNQGMVQISRAIDSDTYLRYQAAYGVGQLTGIDLAGEVSAEGLVYTKDTLGPVERATCSFGQGFNMTPIQLITAFAAAVNGGEYLQPYVVSQVTDAKGNVVLSNSKTVLRHTVSEETSRALRPILQDQITENLVKVSHIYSLPGYTFGGKTGTAQQEDYGKTKDIVSFVAFTPVDDPEIILLVVLSQDDNAESLHACQTSFNIMQKILPVLEIYPEK